MTPPLSWYILKTETGYCQIVSDRDLPVDAAQKRWGPFDSREAAIARRVGLIRAGKCTPC